jgi:hypothetical protein
MSSSVPWGDFSQDPRRPESAGLRASDSDRDVVLGILGEGYADGRLTKDEYDERAGATSAAKTLGELPVLILDLVPQQQSVVAGSGLALATPDELQTRAEQKWQAARRSAFTGVLAPSLICWVIWMVAGFGFPWPLFVTLGTGMNLVRVLTHRQDIVLEERRRLEKKQRKALEGPKPPPREAE